LVGVLGRDFHPAVDVLGVAYIHMMMYVMMMMMMMMYVCMSPMILRDSDKNRWMGIEGSEFYRMMRWGLG